MKKITALLICALMMCAVAFADEISLEQGDVFRIDPENALIDLDGDGIADEIKLTETISDEGEFYALSVNGETLEGDGWGLNGGMYAMRLYEDNRGYLLVTEDGPSDDPAFYLYRYSPEGLEYCGAMGVDAGTIKVTDTGFSAEIRGKVLHTWWHTAEFIIADGGYYDYEADEYVSYPSQVVLVPRGLYEMGAVVELSRDLPLLSTQSGEETVVLPAGSRAVIVGTDDADWLYITGFVDYEHGLSGESGWLKLNQYGYSADINGETVETGELFKGLIYAD